MGAADYSYPSNNNNDHDHSACSLTTSTTNMSHQPSSSQDNSNMHPYIISPLQMQAGPAADTVRSVSTPCSSSSNSSSPSQQELQQYMDTTMMMAFSRSTPPPTTLSSQQPTTQDLDAYAYVPYKANLHVRGDLNTMVQHWTQEEWQQQRRLVRFWRQQTTGPDDVECTFAPISQSEHPEQASMIVVSCIYWCEMDDFYITSVDCLYLLECLLAVRFTVEEKNRIRRNLEEFKPLTVSRSKVESASFFRLVMGFPNPRPRNIEKDVKVFPWKSLSQALKKIIGRYTATYSSTASVNFTALAYTTTSSTSMSGSSSYHDLMMDKDDDDPQQ
ncbi:hypothetical protein K492DRAFT_174031 [Lichtheimia hyalospora FSU 10163]|nr:hypothetical protein K492DRAFT_174031 [Lichtheimia hyalospora FSU 10163]